MQDTPITTDTATYDRRVFPRKTLRIAASRPALLRARDGQLWATFEASRTKGARREWDYFLERGQCMRLEAGDVVLVGAADARRGLASLDVEPILMQRRAPAWRVLLQRVLATAPVRARAFAHA